jgi:hypothetical protein
LIRNPELESADPAVAEWMDTARFARQLFRAWIYSA